MTRSLVALPLGAVAGDLVRPSRLGRRPGRAAEVLVAASLRRRVQPGRGDGDLVTDGPGGVDTRAEEDTAS